MNIKFEVVRWKNLLSTGSQFTEVRLDRSLTTLIIGENGQGKCVDPSTKIEVEILDHETYRKFIEYFS